MHKLDAIRCFYQEQLCREGDDAERLGWENRSAHEARFEVLVKNCTLAGCSILDVGCGLGSLYTYLRGLELNFSYTGIDILPEMTAEAAGRFPQARFMTGDVFTENLFRPGEFDLVFSSGVFNLNLGNNDVFFPRAVDVLYSLASEAVVFNLLHAHSPGREDRFYYYHPHEVETILQRVLPAGFQLNVIEEYLPNDFTVILRKKGSGLEGLSHRLMSV